MVKTKFKMDTICLRLITQYDKANDVEKVSLCANVICANYVIMWIDCMSRK
jgi:hypothetical protein